MRYSGMIFLSHKPNYKSTMMSLSVHTETFGLNGLEKSEN